MKDISLYNDIIVTDIVAAAIQELDILFSTTPTEMIGNQTYGVNFLQFLWQMTPSEDSLQEYIMNKIETSTLYARRLRHDVFVESFYDEAEMVYVVSITIYKDKDDEGTFKKYLIRS
jgi:hypothetical protein